MHAPHVLTSVAAHQKLTLEGDVVVEGDVGHAAEIIVLRGSLTVKGKTGDTVTLTADGDIKVQDAGHTLHATTQGHLTGGRFLHFAKIKAAKDVRISAVGQSSRIDAGKDVTLDTLGFSAAVDAQGAVDVRYMDRYSFVRSAKTVTIAQADADAAIEAQGGVTAGKLGLLVTIKASAVDVRMAHITASFDSPQIQIGGYFDDRPGIKKGKSPKGPKPGM